MNGKVVEKGFVLTPTMALTIILFLAGAVGGLYWRSNAAMEKQSDEIKELNKTLARMDQKLSDKADYDKERIRDSQEQFSKFAQTQDAMWKVNEKRLAKLEGRN